MVMIDEHNESAGGGDAHRGIVLVDVRLDHPRTGEPLISDASLAVTAGEVVVIHGAAGVGTSCVAAAALGERPLGRGRIELLGHDVARLRRGSLRNLRRKIGVVPQDLCLLEDRSAQVNVMMPLEIDGIPRSVSILRAFDCLSRLGLSSEASLPVDCLSTSARQRVAVARALVRSPAILIADHPTSQQDAEGAELVLDAIAEAAAGGAACLVLGRDPSLRAIAEQQRWRQLAIIDGKLRGLSEIALDGSTMEELLIGMESVPSLKITRPPLDVSNIPNIVPFPITARTAGAR
jgi:ABC-type ATPase involved in cell division